MNNWNEICIFETASIFEGMNKLENSKIKFLVITSSQGELLGTLSDGDVRRAILKNKSVSENITVAMNNHPIYANINNTKKELLKNYAR